MVTKLSLGLPGGPVFQCKDPAGRATWALWDHQGPGPCAWSGGKGDEVRGQERTKKPQKVPSFLYNQGRSRGGLYLR